MTINNIEHRIVIAGCGSMGRAWAKHALERPNARIVGLVDLYESSARAFAEHFNLDVPIFADVNEALNAVNPTLLFNITTPENHYAITSAAIARGIAVFSEKPMAASMVECRELAAEASSARVPFAVMQNRRFLPHTRAISDFVRGGGIGAIGSIHADFFLGPHFGGFRDLMDHPLILDMAIHTFDQARQICGAVPVSVYCHEYNPPGSWYATGSSAVAIFEMSDGSVFTYRGSWSAEGFATSWEADWRVIGEKGTVCWDGATAPRCEVVDEAQPASFVRQVKHVEIPIDWQGRNAHDGCLDEMFAALEEGRPAETAYSDNVHSMAMVFGAIESAKSGKKIQLM